MIKIEKRKTSIVFIDEDGKLQSLPVVQHKTGDGHFSHPEGFLFVHASIPCVRDKTDYIIETEDQTIKIDACKVFKYKDMSICSAVETAMPQCDEARQWVIPFDADVSVIIADPYTDPECMSMFFNVSYELSDDYDEGCPVCVQYRNQIDLIIEFLNGAVLMTRDLRTDLFTQKNMKRAIILKETSLLCLFEWLTTTFEDMFQYAKIKVINFEDVEDDSVIFTTDFK